MVRLAGVTDPGRVDPDPGRIDPDPTLKQNLGPAVKKIPDPRTSNHDPYPCKPEFRDPVVILIWIFPYPDSDSAFCIIIVGYRGQGGKSGSL